MQLQAKQMKFQRIVVTAALVLSCAMLVMALGFSTDLYSLNYHSDESSSMLYVKGAELFHKVQPFNRQLLRDAAIELVLCIFLFVFLTHRRRLYYASNYIVSLVYTGFSGYLAAMLFVNAQYIKAQYQKIDFEAMRAITEMLNMKYVESTFMMDAATALSILTFALDICLIINLVLKSAWMRAEKKAVKEAA